MADLWKDFDYTKYTKLMYALQQGVAMMQNHNGGLMQGETSPKSLRVSVTGVQLESSALIALLVEKGIVTPMEFEAKLFEMLTSEVRKYEKRLSAKEGNQVNLIE